MPLTVPTQRTALIADITSALGQAVRVVWSTGLPANPPAVIPNHYFTATQLVQPGSPPAAASMWALVQELCNAGYVVINPHNDGDSWTNNAAVADGPDAEAAALSFLGLSSFSRLCLLGISMGGGLAVQQAKNATFATPLKGLYLLDPGVNLRNLYGFGALNATVKPSIETAFSITAATLSAAMATTGLTSVPTTGSYPTIGTQLLLGIGTANEEIVTTTGASTGTAVAVTATTKTHANAEKISDYPTKTAGHDPALLTSAQIPTGLRWRFVASTSDTTADKTQNTDVLRATIAAMSVPPAEYDLATHADGHIGRGAYWSRDPVEFFARCI